MPTHETEKSGSPLSSDQRAMLIARAKAAIQQAYAPYSRFRVGAAVLTESEKIYTGCNVENASYGLTICAERAAVFSAVAAEGPELRLRAVAVWSNPEMPCAPCGACRQVIFEFGRDSLVLYQGPHGTAAMQVCDLLPDGFRL